MRIALVSPWPPEASGIAHYAADLANQFIDLGVQVEHVGRHMPVAEALKRLREQDVVVYQFGNNADYHAWMLPLLERIPGVVHLHDLVLHHLAAIAMERAGQLTAENYAEILQGWYPAREVMAAVGALEAGLPIWASDAVTRIPLFEPVVRLATAVVVHSEFAARSVRARFPYLPVHVVPQMYTLKRKPGPRVQLRTISVMGGGEVNRRFDWLADALVALDGRLASSLVLEITGQLNDAVAPQIERLARLAQVELKLLGRVNEEAFDAAFARADLMIAFRHPTMGETSAVATRALQSGVPMVVTDSGWYGELPHCARKIAPGEDAARHLAALIHEVVADPGAYAKWAEQCHATALSLVDGARTAARGYLRMLEEVRVQEALRERVAGHLAALGISFDVTTAGPLAAFDVHCSFHGPQDLAGALAAGQRRLQVEHEASIEAGVPSGPLNEGDFRCRLELDAKEVTLKAGEALELSVHVSNLSNVPFGSPGPARDPAYGIFIGSHWQRRDADAADCVEGLRARLQGLLAPGQTSCNTLRLRAPDQPGDYELIVDLVQEQVAWFRHKQGQAATLRVRVDGGSACG